MTVFASVCDCGRVGVDVTSAPSVRFRCHCSICQSVYASAFSDVLVFRRGQVRAIEPTGLKWTRTKTVTPLVRGLCTECNGPVLAHFYGLLSFVPAGAITDLKIPPVAQDIYYGTRRADLTDHVPKTDSLLGAYARLTLPFLKTLALPARPPVNRG